MSYYILKPATNSLEIGNQYPQVQKMSPGYNYKASNSVHALSRAYQEFPDFEPDLNYFIVHSQAKVTDLLSVTPVHGGFLISERLKNIFEQFKIAPHRNYPAKLKHKKNFYDNYFWMHIICDLTDFVDYQKSSFFIYYNYGHNIGTVDNIISKKDYLLKEEKIKQDNPGKSIALWAQKIHLNNDFNKDTDLFKISTFDSNYYISTPLKEKITMEKITGCDISPANNLTF